LSLYRIGGELINFSKKLMVFASVIYAATWLVMVYSWFALRESPDTLKEYTTYLYGAAFAFYSAKSCIENKAKIEKSKNKANKKF